MTGWRAVYRRELASYFATPVALVFIIIFLVTTAAFTFFVGGFFDAGRADLTSFFRFHPWLFLFLGPAMAMRLWAEERRTGTIELLLTLPVSTAGAVLGKFFAAWTVTSLALILTAPLWLTVNLLGDPDNGVIFASYLGSALMMGGYLAIGTCLSAATRNQVIAFIMTVAMCFLFLAAGLPLVQSLLTGWAPTVVLNIIGGWSFLTRFESITRGVLDLRDLVYFISLIIAWLAGTVIVVDLKREQG